MEGLLSTGPTPSSLVCFTLSPACQAGNLMNIFALCSECSMVRLLCLYRAAVLYMKLFVLTLVYYSLYSWLTQSLRVIKDRSKSEPSSGILSRRRNIIK